MATVSNLSRDSVRITAVAEGVHVKLRVVGLDGAAQAQAAADEAQEILDQINDGLADTVKVTVQSFDSSEQEQARDNIGLGTAAVEDIGTSGATVPLLSTQNAFSDRQSFDRTGTLVLSNDIGQQITSANLNAAEGLRFQNSSDTGNITSMTFLQGTTSAGRGAIILRKTGALTSEFLFGLRNADANLTFNAALRSDGDMEILGALETGDPDTTIANLSANLSTLSDYGVSNDSTLAGNSATELVTVHAVKAYVDANVAGATQEKASVRAATTTTLPACTYANGADGVGATLTGNANGAIAAQDGITLVANDELLVKNQAAGLQNGAYTVTTVGTGGTPFVLTRVTDSDEDADLPGAQWLVMEGSTQATTKWKVSNSSVDVGTTSIVIVQTFAASVYTAGTGLDLTGQQFSVEANLAGLNSSTGTAANKAPYSTALNTWSQYNISAFGRTWANLANADAGITALGIPYVENFTYFPDITTAMAEDLSAYPYIYVGGFAAEGDAPVTRWKQLLSAPDHDGGEVDAGANDWEPDREQGPIDVRAVGVTVDGSTVDTDAWNVVISMINDEYSDWIAPGGTSVIDAKLDTITADDGASIKAIGGRLTFEMQDLSGIGEVLQIGDATNNVQNFELSNVQFDLSDVQTEISGDDVCLWLRNCNQPKLTGVSSLGVGTAVRLGYNAGGTEKAPVRAATTAALPASSYNNGASGVGAYLEGSVNGALTAQDGITLSAGDELLVKNQSAKLENGAYTVTTVGDAGTKFKLTRVTDSDQDADLAEAQWTVQEGSTLAGTQWMVSNRSVTVGTTSIFIDEAATNCGGLRMSDCRFFTRNNLGGVYLDIQGANGGIIESTTFSQLGSGSGNTCKGIYFHPGQDNVADSMMFRNVRVNMSGDPDAYVVEIDATDAAGLGNVQFSDCVLDQAGIANIYIHIDDLDFSTAGVQVMFSNCVSNGASGQTDSVVLLDNSGESPYFNIAFDSCKFSTSRNRTMRFIGDVNVQVTDCTFQDRSASNPTDDEHILIEDGVSNVQLLGNAVKERTGGVPKDYFVTFAGDASNIQVMSNNASIVTSRLINGGESISDSNRSSIIVKDNIAPGQHKPKMVQTGALTPVTVAQFTLDDETSYILSAIIHGQRTNGANRAYIENRALAYRNDDVSPGAFLEGQTELVNHGGATAAWSVSGNDALFTITPGTTALMDWYGLIEVSSS